ncbi:protein DD3-3-like [Rhopilema esculentum]|uniref:protein DD3-3-like n=1 Tax=Rhopilema esculentum TaxID=499914 RepID=UPI0031CE4551
MSIRCIAIFLTVLACAYADMYFHNPRGSNNRLNGGGRDRQNANRLFDSQNNARGGYNVGNLYYYAGSVLPIQWTNQHSCNDPNNNCEIVIQYMCHDRLRDGTTERTIPEHRHQCKNFNCNSDLRFGMHEDFDYYQECKRRQRNTGLFVADQNLKGSTAKYTRQNPGGTRRGYECPEEKDYYPYWHSSPWKDIVVMTNDVKRCDFYKKESQNAGTRWGCQVPKAYFTCEQHLRNLQIPNTKEECENIRYPPNDPYGEKAVWKEYPAHGVPAPDCIQSPWSRDNHNGNGRNGYMNTYNWTVPNIEAHSCVMRIRYNISTNDYDSWKTDSASVVDIGENVGLEKESAKARGYVFKNNPVVKVSNNAPKLQLRLAINTAQFGRTFQDRSHVFSIEKRSPELAKAEIHNVNVRGKRGNIVQTYPAMEYDFVPNTLHIKEGHYIHFQWTGSDRNPRNNAGEGRAGTDRSNVILLADQIYPEGKPKINVFGQYGRNFPKNISEARFLGMHRVELKKAAILHPGSGPTLDEAGTYFDLGPKKVTGSGTYFYMCTRNNNFSNRSQKGKIVIVKSGGGTSSDTATDVMKDEKEVKEALKKDEKQERYDSLADLDTKEVDVKDTKDEKIKEDNPDSNLLVKENDDENNEETNEDSDEGMHSGTELKDDAVNKVNKDPQDENTVENTEEAPGNRYKRVSLLELNASLLGKGQSDTTVKQVSK